MIDAITYALAVVGAAVGIIAAGKAIVALIMLRAIVKARWTLLPWRAMARVLAVLEYGACHYGPDNWRRVEGLRNRYLNAALRHIVAVLRGEWLDPDTGEPHLAHAIASLAFVLEDAELSAAAPSITDRAEAAAQRATLDGLTMMAAREAMTGERRTALRPDGWDELRGEGPRSEVQF